MSQEKSSKKGNILFAIFLLLIIAIAGTLTFYAIYYHNKQEKENNKLEEETKEPFLTFKSVSKKDTIDVFKNYPINPITVTYDDKVSITGLKDKEIETKVNEILSSLDSSKDQYGNSCETNFNVSNVLSISCKEESKNINLITGEEIKLEEIFNKDSDITNTLLKSVYLNYCEYNNCYAPDELEEEEYDNTIENDIVELFSSIKNQNYNFSIYYTSFLIKKDQDYGDDYDNYDNYIYCYYEDFYKDLTIYNRFLTDDKIYEKEVSEYCNPTNCYSKTEKYDASNQYSLSDFLNDTNYLDITIYNNTNYDAGENKATEQELDLKTISEKIKEELISKYNLKSSNNYRYVNVQANIYSNDEATNQIVYRIEDTTLDKEDFTLKLLASELTNPIKEKITDKGNMLIDKENKISYLDEDPKAYFDNFDELAYEYIMSKVNDPDNYEFDYYRNCEFAEDYEECEAKKDYHALLQKDATYAVDEKNKRILVYHYIPGIGMPESYVKAFIPFSALEKEAISPTD